MSDARGRPPSNKQGNTHVAGGGKGMKNRKWRAVIERARAWGRSEEVYTLQNVDYGLAKCHLGRDVKDGGRKPWGYLGEVPGEGTSKYRNSGM